MVAWEDAGADVVIADDDAAIRDMLGQYLDEAGYRVATATNGAELLAHIQRETPPRLILLDLAMPGVDGWQYLHRRELDPQLASIPVVLISGYGDIARQAVASRNIECFSKPLNLKDLLASVRRHCA